MFDALLTCARSRDVWNSDQYVVDSNGRFNPYPLQNRPAVHHYNRVGSDRLGTVNTNDFVSA